jgi:NAD(P)-binding Rossmann-like domain
VEGSESEKPVVPHERGDTRMEANRMATTASSGAEAQPQIDKGALLAKYRAEPDKRLRADGNAQYLPLKGRFAHDPYTPVAQREAKTDHLTFAFIGGGFAGLATCARMFEAGVQDVRIIEKGGDFGGTWYWNRYPSAQCGTAPWSIWPLLEGTGYRPTEKYAHAPEILAYCRRIGGQFRLYENALFHTEVENLGLG